MFYHYDKGKMNKRLLYTLALVFVTIQTFAQGTVKYEYDANNRLTLVTYSNGVTVSYTYDELGNRLSKKVTGAAPIKKGDVNGDGDVDIADAVCIVNHIVGKPNSVFVEAAADVNNDGDIDIADAVRIVNYVVGKINAFARRASITLPKPE